MLTTDSLSPNIIVEGWEFGPNVRNRILGPMIGTPRYMSVVLCILICLIAVLAAVDLAPKVAVFTIFCVFANQSNGVLLTKCSTAVTALPLALL